MPKVLLVALAVAAFGVAEPVRGDGKVYTSNSLPNEIRRANLDGSGSEVLVPGLPNGPFGIALDLEGGKMYWAEENSRRITRANLDGSDVDPILTSLPGFPADVALDVAAGKIYWVEFAGTAQSVVRRANLDGSAIEDLVALQGAGNRNGIALDLSAGKVYWTLCLGVIRRANLDGSGVEDVVSGLGCLVDIDLDLVSGKMYWSESMNGDGMIRRANLDGSGLETILDDGLNAPLEIGLDLISGHVYWNDAGQETLERADLDGGNRSVLLMDVIAWGLALDLRTIPVFGDGFESGSTDAWSAVFP